MKKILAICLVGMLTVMTGCQTTDTVSEDIIYVDTDATGNNDGSSWADAYTLLQDALEVSADGNEIWVAEGSYYPSVDGDMDVSFNMVDGVAIYGGFAGTETSIDERDWEVNVTTLSGDLGVLGDTSDNSVKVVIAANNIIDGFTISDGSMGASDMMMGPPSDTETRGDGETMTPPEGTDTDMASDIPTGEESEDTDSGSAGHLSPDAVMEGDATSSGNGNGIIIWGVAPTIQNCIITNNTGGKGAGVYINGNDESGNLPTFINTTISNNVASGRGGGVSIDSWTYAIFIDCIFDSNECTNGKGGAIYNDFSGNPYLENCLFVNNYSQSGGAIGNDGASNPVISNTTFYNNTASEEGAVLYQGSGPFNDPIVMDSVLWGNYCDQGQVSVYNWNECNPLIEYSIVQDGYDGQGVVDVDPLFVDADNMDFNYEEDSPALSAASDGGAIGFDADLIDNRTEEDYQELTQYLQSITNESVIIEMDFTNPIDSSQASDISSLVYVDADASGSSDGSSFANAFTSLQDAIDYAGAAYELNETDVEVWVAEGTYYSGDERSDSIILRTGVNIYGGFVGDETSLEDRDYETNVTILSGEIGDTSVATDNSYHVVIGADDAVIDGFTITGGYADGVDGAIYDSKGGGLINYLGGNRVRPDEEPTLGFDIEISNCIFTDNYADEGGASYTYHGGNPVYDNCTFVENTAEYGGAVLDRAGTNSKYTDCTFTDNEAIYKGGAAFVDYGSMATLTNCDFDGNEAQANGGAIYAIDRASQAVPNETDFDLIDPTWSSMTDIYSAVYLDTCTFTNNTAGFNGGALYIYDSSFAKIVNSVFDGNSANDAAIVANSSSTIMIDTATSIINSSPRDTYSDGGRSSITFE